MKEQRGTVAFDLERARGLRDFLQDDCAEVGDVWGEMIAEIERLRAENEDLSKAVIDIQEERDLAQAEFRSYHRAWEEQAARVQELEGMLSIRTEELDIAHSVARSEKEMHEKELAAFARRIKELEEVLVEMVATNPCNIPTLCDVVHDELMCPALDGNCDFWKGCPQKNELREAARKQLQAEGKIGNGDHIAETDQMVPCWQITEERKETLRRALEEYKIFPNDQAVLRAMLTEAGL